MLDASPGTSLDTIKTVHLDDLQLFYHTDTHIYDVRIPTTLNTMFDYMVVRLLAHRLLPILHQRYDHHLSHSPHTLLHQLAPLALLDGAELH